MLVRFYTVDQQAIGLYTWENQLAHRFGGFTRFTGSGAWNNGSVLGEEPAAVYEVEVTDSPNVRASVSEFAESLRIILNQEAVLVVTIPSFSFVAFDEKKV